MRRLLLVLLALVVAAAPAAAARVKDIAVLGAPATPSSSATASSWA